MRRLSEILPHVERAGLNRARYRGLAPALCQTLQAWAGRFEANRDKAQAMYDERFCRMWEFYLRGARYVFLYEHHVVWEIQLAKNVYALPNITRDYIAARENELRERESQQPTLRVVGE
jgi:cyclopropane-fatty-acyl-phospholipid synthase